MKPWSEYAYRSADALMAALAENLREQTADALAARGRAVLALAGGSTPLPAYRQFADAALDWREVVLLPTDERCVPHAHRACNVRALREATLAAHGARVMPLTREDGEPHASLQRANESLSAIAGPFDAVVLGMGNDAHTASLFPGAAELPAALAQDAPDALLLHPQPMPPEAPFARITLSVQRLRRARVLHLCIVGAAKREALRRAQASQDALLTPISALLHAPDVHLHIHWSPA